MRRYKFRGKLLRIEYAKNYIATQSKVRLGGTLSDSFQLTTGLREGCVLSLLLFSIFVTDLAEELENVGVGSK